MVVRWLIDRRMSFVEEQIINKSWHYAFNSRRRTEERTCRIVVLHLRCSLQFLFHCAAAPQWARASSFTRFLDHTRRRTTVGRTPLDEWSARRTDLYLTTHNTHKRKSIHAPSGIRTRYPSKRAVAEPALDRAATGTGFFLISFTYIDLLIFCAALFYLCYWTTLNHFPFAPESN